MGRSDQGSWTWAGSLKFINASSTHVGFQIGVGTATINAKGNRVFSQKLAVGSLVQGKKRFGQRTLRRNNEYKNTCNHPNRLNLLSWTARLGSRSNYLRKKWVKTGCRGTCPHTQSQGFAVRTAAITPEGRIPTAGMPPFVPPRRESPGAAI